MKDKYIEGILDLPMGENDAKAKTIRGYLYKLLITLWYEDEGFSGKRPFGDSGWSYDLYQPLVFNGIVEGSVDEDGCLEDFNEKQAVDIIATCIAYVFRENK